MPRPRGIGMPKPKKKKLQDVNDDSQPSTMDAGIDADPSKGSAARPSPMVEALSRKLPGALRSPLPAAAARCAHATADADGPRGSCRV